MSIFQVSSRSVQVAAPPKKKPRRLRREWSIAIHFVLAVSVSGQWLIERSFNVRNREAVKAIDAFTATLREEIDLDQLRERFLTVIQHTMQPYSVSLWIRISREAQEPSSSTKEILVADDDPLIAYVLSHPGAREVDQLPLDSPVLQELKLHAAEMILPLASQGELIGLLILGPHLQGEAYTHEERTMLDTLAPRSHRRCVWRKWYKSNRCRCANANASSRNYGRLGTFSTPFCPKTCRLCPAGSSPPTTNRLARSEATSTISYRLRMAV